MIGAFLFGGGVQYFLEPFIKGRPQNLRNLIYKGVVFYLLFKIGFGGGAALVTEPLTEITFTGSIAVFFSILWTFIVLGLLRYTTSFSEVVRVSIATHFGSVSVGTFVAGLAFLDSLGYQASDSVVVWLALMELPAIFVGVLMLKIPLINLFKALGKDTSFLTLVTAIFLGILFSDLNTYFWYDVFFKVIFTPVLIYFLFEMGRKAASSLKKTQVSIGSLLWTGVGMAFLGGVWGTSVAFLLGYSASEAFVFAILLASASYVLVPICMEEIFKSSSIIKTKAAQKAIATSVALSVGIVLPFNILFGFEIYYFLFKFLGAMPWLSWGGIILPFAVLLCFYVQTKFKR